MVPDQFRGCLPCLQQVRARRERDPPIRRDRSDLKVVGRSGPVDLPPQMAARPDALEVAHSGKADETWRHVVARAVHHLRVAEQDVAHIAYTRTVLSLRLVADCRSYLIVIPSTKRAV
jgi:hypothetical protein